MTFIEYIKKRRVTDTLAGDFTEDAKLCIRIRRFPEINSFEQLECYLVHQHAAEGAFLGARIVWRAYLKARKR